MQLKVLLLLRKINKLLKLNIIQSSCLFPLALSFPGNPQFVCVSRTAGSVLSGGTFLVSQPKAATFSEAASVHTETRCPVEVCVIWWRAIKQIRPPRPVSSSNLHHISEPHSIRASLCVCLVFGQPPQSYLMLILKAMATFWLCLLVSFAVLSLGLDFSRIKGELFVYSGSKRTHFTPKTTQKNVFRIFGFHLFIYSFIVLCLSCKMSWNDLTPLCMGVFKAF